MDQSALLSCTVHTNPAPGLLLSNLRMMMMSANLRTRVRIKCLPFDGEYQLLEDTGVEEQVGANHPVQLVLEI